jgi:endonuclease-8
VLELSRRRVDHLGPDILAEPLDLDGIVARLRAHASRDLGDALLDQRLVSGIGNVWKAESLWRALVSPWRRVGDTGDDELREVLTHAATLMHESLDGGRPARHVYRKAGRPCPRCGRPISSRGQGDDNRTAYWCDCCQR